MLERLYYPVWGVVIAILLYMKYAMKRERRELRRQRSASARK
jgi:hypothetical protein